MKLGTMSLTMKVLAASAALGAAACADEPGRAAEGPDEAASQAASALNWSEAQKLSASDAAAMGRFGSAIAISADTVIVGSLLDDELGADAGAAYVFVRAGGSWTQQQKLVASDGAANDRFGTSVSVSGDTAIVGAPGSDKKAADGGAAYVFVRSGGVWTEDVQLLSSDEAAGDAFGSAVALSMDTAVVGAPHDADKGADTGSAYVFERTAGAFTQTMKLGASDAAAGDLFGSAVAADGTTALVGAFQSDVTAMNAGSAYAFVKTAGLWMQQQALTAMDGTAGDNFGGAVALSGDTALVGASFDGEKGIAAGSAYVFLRAGSAWGELQKIVPADAAGGGRFGVSVSVSGDLAAIGSFASDAMGKATGAAYVYERASGSFFGETKIVAADAAPQDEFSASVGVAGVTLVVGAPASDGAGADSGAAYVYEGTISNGKPCKDGANCLSGQCVDGVCCNSACGGGATSDCQACSKMAGGAVDGTCGLVVTGLECRASTGECDAPEICDGSGLACPDDKPASDGTACSMGVCQAGVCGEAVVKPPPPTSDDGGLCSYRAPVGGPGAPEGAAGAWLLGLALGALASRRVRSESPISAVRGAK